MANFITSTWRFALNVLPILLIGLLAGYTLSWWTIAPVAFVFTAFKKQYSPLNGFLTSFFSGFLLWFTYAAVLNYGNDGVMASRIGSMLSGGNAGLSAAVLLLITGLIGGLVAGLGGISGVYAREMKSSN